MSSYPQGTSVPKHPVSKIASEVSASVALEDSMFNESGDPITGVIVLYVSDSSVCARSFGEFTDDDVRHALMTRVQQDLIERKQS